MSFNRETSVGYVTHHLARLLEKNLAQAIRPLGLTPGQFPVLLALWNGDGLSQKALVDITDVEQATMANTLARMERDGLIRREPDPSDNRSRLAFLTDRAQALEKDAIDAAERVNATACAGMPAAEHDRLLSLMHTLISNLSARPGRTPTP